MTTLYPLPAISRAEMKPSPVLAPVMTQTFCDTSTSLRARQTVLAVSWDYKYSSAI